MSQASAVICPVLDDNSQLEIDKVTHSANPAKIAPRECKPVFRLNDLPLYGGKPICAAQPKTEVEQMGFKSVTLMCMAETGNQIIRVISFLNE
jgi:hypothetical protein